MGIKMLTSDTL